MTQSKTKWTVHILAKFKFNRWIKSSVGIYTYLRDAKSNVTPDDEIYYGLIQFFR